MAAEKYRAAVLEVDKASRRTRVFASGLRNPNGLSWNPESGELWSPSTSGTSSATISCRTT